MNKKPAGSFYRHIIRDAWEVTRKNHILWIFGFFVSFLGNGGVYELLIQGTGRLGLNQDFGGLTAIAGLIPSGPDLVAGLQGIGAYGALTILFGALLVVALLAIALWVVVTSQGSIIVGIRDLLKGRKHTFATLFNDGTISFWPLLGLNALSRASITAFFYLLLALLVLLLTKATLASGLLYLVAFLVIVPLTLVIGFVTIFAACYVVIYRMRLVEAIETAIALFRGYWLIAVETAVILFAVNVIVAFALGVALLILAMAVLLVYGYVVVASGAAPWILLVIGATMGLTMIVMTGAGLAAFQYAVWTGLFIKLNQRGHGAVAKIVRLFQRALGRR